MRRGRRAALILATLPLLAARSDGRVWPKGVDLPAGTAVSEDYRAEFDRCDTHGRFRGHRSRYTTSCPGDPNAVTALRRLPGGAIAYVSKLAVDLDGSPFACSPQRGPMDQCPTSLMLPGPHGRELPVDSDRIPYVVIPEAGPKDARGEFARLTGVGVGDFGVVIWRGRLVPVIVADTGPYSKLGEGSLALHRALGRALCRRRDAHGTCIAMVEPMESVGGDVTTVLFPHTALASLDRRTLAATVRREGLAHWRALRVRLGLAPRE